MKFYNLAVIVESYVIRKEEIRKEEKVEGMYV